jgi:polyphosphate glucokinase
MKLLGIDIGGSGIKGAVVETRTGELVMPRYRIPTPEGAKPKAVAGVVGEIVQHFKWKGPVGVGFPAIIINGVAFSAANVSKKWIDTNAETLFAEATGCPVRVLNDADAAGLAEMRFGAGRGQKGTVLVITIGTGLGSALFRNGMLVPNAEFGHIEMNCGDAEKQASEAAKVRENLSWKEWSGRFNEYLRILEDLISPDLIILGGGASKESEKFMDRLNPRARILPAAMLNEAGIVGAALAAEELAKKKKPARKSPGK